MQKEDLSLFISDFYIYYFLTGTCNQWTEAKETTYNHNKSWKIFLFQSSSYFLSSSQKLFKLIIIYILWMYYLYTYRNHPRQNNSLSILYSALGNLQQLQNYSTVEYACARSLVVIIKSYETHLVFQKKFIKTWICNLNLWPISSIRWWNLIQVCGKFVEIRMNINS